MLDDRGEALFSPFYFLQCRSNGRDSFFGANQPKNSDQISMVCFACLFGRQLTHGRLHVRSGPNLRATEARKQDSHNQKKPGWHTGAINAAPNRL
jgi:hypothetical protein